MIIYSKMTKKDMNTLAKISETHGNHKATKHKKLEF